MSKWVLFFDQKTRESQEFFFKSLLPFIMRLIVGKKRQEWQREIFLRISTHTHTPPPRLLDDGIQIEITESSSRRRRRAPRQKNKRRTRDRRWTSSSFFLFASLGGSLAVVDAKGARASERGSAFFLRAWNWNSKNFLFCNERRNLTNSSHHVKSRRRRAARTPRRPNRPPGKQHLL